LSIKFFTKPINISGGEDVSSAQDSQCMIGKLQRKMDLIK